MAKGPPNIADYEMLRPIGRGAFGEVWLARAVTGQYRAVKVLRCDELPHPRAFEREFAGVVCYEPVSRTQRNLVPILHVGRTADGQSFWYVMELADDAGSSGRSAHSAARPEAPFGAGAARGSPPAEAWVNSYEPCTLRSVLRARGRLPVEECVRVALGILDATAFLHARDLVHRDIKPSNVIFVGGVPKLADIGLVTTSEEAPSFVGTAGYIPPDGPGTRAADIYALGKVLYEMATGRPAHDFPRLPEDFTTAGERRTLIDFNEILLRAADNDVRRRYGSVEELRSDLLLLEAGRSVRRWRGLERRLKVASRVGAVVAGIAFVSVALGVWANRERLRALAADRELSARFVEQQRSLARATRLTGLPGQRTRALEIIGEAARQTNSLALRNEAIAALALPDVSHFRTITGGQMAFDSLMRRYALNETNGDFTVRSLEDDRVLAHLSVGAGSESSPAPTELLGFDFSGAGEYFCAAYGNRQFLIWRISSWPPDADSRKLGAGGEQAPKPVPPRKVPLAFKPSRHFVVPGGRLAGVEGDAGTLHFFDLEEGRQVRTIKGSFPSWIAFSSDGVRFASIRENFLRIHDSATGEVLQSLTNGTGFDGLFWHPDGRQIATVSGERALRLWNLETGHPSGVLRGHEAEVITAAFDPNGQWMLSASWDNQTVLWNLPQQKEVLRLSGSGNSLRVSADARRVAWHSWNGRQWDIFELTPPTELVWLEQHPGLETPLGLRSLWGVAFLDTKVIAGVGDAGFCVWQPPAGYASVLANIGLERPLFALPGRELFSSGAHGLRRWPITVNAAQKDFYLGPPERLSPASLLGTGEFAVSRDGRRMAFVTANHQLFLRTERDSSGWRELASGTAYGPTIDPTGRFVAAPLRSGGVRIWDAENGSTITNLSCSLGRACDVSPDGRWLSVATMESFLVWRVADWQLVHRIRRTGVSGPVHTWSPDGEMFLVNDLDSTVRLVRTGSWEELSSLPSPKLLRHICFSPDASRLALASEKSGVELWDLRRLRKRLAELGLDWTSPPNLPVPEELQQGSWTIRVDPGSY